MTMKWDRNTLVFIDTSSLMEGKASDFIESFLEPKLDRVPLKLHVPIGVVKELQKHTLSNEERGRSATEALQLLKKLQLRDKIELCGEPSDPFVDNLLIGVFTRFRTQRRLVLITQDRRLAYEILRLGASTAVSDIKGIEALRVSKIGGVDCWNLEESSPDGVRYESLLAWKAVRPTSFVPKNPFDRIQRVTSIPNSVLSRSPMVKEGDLLFDSNGVRYQLRKQIGEGGEGAVFQSDNGFVCKVYRSNRATQLAKAKLELMTSRQLDYPGLCWPKAVLYNSQREFSGYAMPRATGREIQKTIFIKPLFAQHFPHWSKRELVTLAISVLRGIQFLHAHNVLIGDLNPRNILLEDERRVYFVDTDSYQVEGFPSPVGMPPYLAPELKGVDLSKTLRTLEHEHFAVATLMFMLLMPGKPPYSHRGGESPAENVEHGHFPYALGDKSSNAAPDGPWILIWSNLPFYIKQTFTNVFASNQRPSVEDWLDLMVRYRKDIDAGRVPSGLFPTKFKPLSREQVEQKGGIWATCAYHKGEFGWFPRGKNRTLPEKPMCRDCAEKKVIVTCAFCRTEIRSIRLFEFVRRVEGDQSKILCGNCQGSKQASEMCCRSCGITGLLLTDGVCQPCAARALKPQHVPTRTKVRAQTANTNPTLKGHSGWVDELSNWLSSLFR